MVSCLDWGDESQYLASGGFDGAVKVWDVRASALVHSACVPGFVQSVAFVPVVETMPSPVTADAQNGRIGGSTSASSSSSAPAGHVIAAGTSKGNLHLIDWRESASSKGSGTEISSATVGDGAGINAV